MIAITVSARQSDRAEEVIRARARERVEPHAREIAADEPTSVGVIVDTGHDQTEHEHRDGVARRLRPEDAASAPAPVMHERADQSENRRRGPQRE